MRCCLAQLAEEVNTMRLIKSAAWATVINSFRCGPDNANYIDYTCWPGGAMRDRLPLYNPPSFFIFAKKKPIIAYWLITGRKRQITQHRKLITSLSPCGKFWFSLVATTIIQAVRHRTPLHRIFAMHITTDLLLTTPNCLYSNNICLIVYNYRQYYGCTIIVFIKTVYNQ